MSKQDYLFPEGLKAYPGEYEPPFEPIVDEAYRSNEVVEKVRRLIDTFDHVGVSYSEGIAELLTNLGILTKLATAATVHIQGRCAQWAAEEIADRESSESLLRYHERSTLVST